MMRWKFFFLALSLLLAACAQTASPMEGSDFASVETEDDGVRDNWLDEELENDDDGILTSEFTTVFYPQVTTLMDEGAQMQDLIMNRIKDTENQMREGLSSTEVKVKNALLADELEFYLLEILEARLEHDIGESVILPSDYEGLADEVIATNIVGYDVEVIDSDLTVDEDELTSTHYAEIEVDGEIYEIAYTLVYEANLKVAEIISFSIDDEEIDF